MFFLIAVLLVLWLLGVVALPSLGLLVHVLLVVAIIALIYQLVTGNKAL